MNIEFGCGDNPRIKGYKTCDVRPLQGVDFVCPAWDIDQLVHADSVENIYSFHFFEHLTFDQGRRVLRAWLKILRPQGRVELVMPNMDFHVEQWRQGQDQEWAEAGFWGWQRESDQDQLWDVHKSGYNHRTLSRLVLAEGYTNYQELRGMKPQHLWAAFTK